MKRIFLGSVIVLLTLTGTGRPQWSVGPHIAISFPTAEFANVSDVGGGLGVKAFYQVRSFGNSGLALRGDFVYITYDSRLESENTTIGPILTQARDESYRLAVGPHLLLGSRSYKFHLGATGGVYLYRTTNAFRSKDTTLELGWNVSGGLSIDIGLGPWLDLDVEYHTIKNIPGPVDDANPDERVDIDANDVTVKAGVLFFLGR